MNTNKETAETIEEIKENVRWIKEISGWINRNIQDDDISSLLQNWNTMNENIELLYNYIKSINE
jgi:hypothetical protein